MPLTRLGNMAFQTMGDPALSKSGNVREAGGWTEMGKRGGAQTVAPPRSYPSTTKRPRALCCVSAGVADGAVVGVRWGIAWHGINPVSGRRFCSRGAGDSIQELVQSLADLHPVASGCHMNCIALQM